MQYSGYLHALVFIELLLEYRVYPVSLIEHQILADQTAEICKSLGETRAAGIEEQSSRFGAVRGDHNRLRLLKMFALVAIEIRHAGAAAFRIRVDPEHVAARSDFATPGGFRFWNHRVQRR